MAWTSRKPVGTEGMAGLSMGGFPALRRRLLRASGSIGFSPRRDALFGGIGRGLGAQVVAEQCTVGLDPIGQGAPLLAVPLLDLGDDGVPLMVVDRGLDRRQQTCGADLLQALGVDV